MKALFLDLSGVLYDGDEAIDGAHEAVKQARDAGLTIRFVTNTATRSHDDILKKLGKMHFDIMPEELFTAPKAAHAYLAENKLRPYCLVHEAIREEFEDLDHDDPDAVVIGDAREELNYANLNRAFQLCHNGASLIGIGMNRYFSEDGEIMLDAGGFIRAVAWAADVKPIIMGKPSQAFFEQIVASTGESPSDCLMVGDDVQGDVIGAIDAGLQGCLVRTGKYTKEDEQQLPEKASCIEHIGKLFDTFEVD